MLVLLMVLSMSAFAFALTCLAFTKAVNYDQPRPEVRPDARPEADLRFFAGDMATFGTSLPRDVLLMQIEKHVRLEQAAAESFLARPTHEGLHAHAARLVN